MSQAFAVMLILGLLGLVVVGAVLGIVAFILVLRGGREADRQASRLDTLLKRVSRLEGVPEVTLPTPPAPALPEPEEKAETVPPEAPPPAPAPRPAAAGEWWTTLEDRVGKRWIAWAGALVLFLSAGFFVKYAIDNDWIGATAQVGAGVVFGIALLVAGDRLVRREMRALGQALMGGGLAILYVSLFAGSSIYDLMPPAVAFVAMAAVTGAGMALAVLHDAQSVAFLAILGGMLTPVLCSTGEDRRDVLFGYLVLLDLGVLGVALFKRWRWLDVLAWGGTAALFTGWFAEFYSEKALAPTLAWLGVFYVIFLLLPFVYHLRHAAPISLERFLLALLHAAGVFGYAYGMLWGEHHYMLGFVALIMAACYLALGAQTRGRIPADRRGLFGFIALAVAFLTIAVPVHMELNGITLLWAVEGPVLLYLGYRYRYLPVRVGGLIVLGLAVIRVFAEHFPLHDMAFVPVWNVSFGVAACVPVAAAAFALIHQRWRDSAGRLDLFCKVLAALAAWALGLIVLHAEGALWLIYRPLVARAAGEYAALAYGVALWSVGAAGCLAAGLRLRSRAARIAGILAFLVPLFIALCIYAEDAPEEYALFANLRFAACLVGLLAVFGCAFALGRWRERIAAGELTLMKVIYAAGGLLTLALLSAESYAYCYQAVADADRASWTALMSLSIVWGLCAAVALVIGFRKRLRPLRLAALGLFAVTALKLVLVDVAGVKQIYRVISFFIMGLLMIGASYLYHRIEKRLEQLMGGGE